MNPAKMPMVSYWKTKEAVQAKVTEINGVTVMMMEGEKYPFPGFPRGYLLFGRLSKLKHEIKNQIFNDSWAKLESGSPAQEINDRLKKDVLPNIFTLAEESAYDFVPPKSMSESVRELHRVWEKVSPNSPWCRIVTHILQEDDAYRFRFQWMVPFMLPWAMKFIDPVKLFERGLVWMENGEIIGDMKERVRLFRRIMLMILSDKENKEIFTRIFREIDWKKIQMKESDKYFFRGKYFKVDLDKFEY